MSYAEKVRLHSDQLTVAFCVKQGKLASKCTASIQLFQEVCQLYARMCLLARCH